MSDLFDVRRKVALITGAPGAFGAVAARVVAGYTACCASQGGGGRDDPGAGLRVADSLRLMGVAADGIVPRIAVVEGIAAAVGEAGFVFEAAPEKMALKQAIFAEAEASAPAMA